LMRSTIEEIDSSGKMTIATTLRATGIDGFHGSISITPQDYTGAPIPENMQSQRFGVDGGQMVTQTWSANFPLSVLQVTRSFNIYHSYSPGSLDDVVHRWEGEIQSLGGSVNWGNIGPQSAGKGGGKTSG
jgi:hypothetical protein